MILLDKPAQCYAARCPMADCVCGHHLDEHNDDGSCKSCEFPACKGFKTKGRGFVLGSGDPKTTKIAMVLEAPGKDEVEFSLGLPRPGRMFYETKAECDAEIEVRKQDFPALSDTFVRKGVPIVGKTGFELVSWVFPNVGLSRRELFVDNTIRCLPPKTKQGAYPKGDERKGAEKACRMWDRLEAFRPDVAVVSLHPAGILREVTPLPLQVKDFERVRDYMKQGLRPMMLLGGKAAKAFVRCCENVTRFRGAYFWLKRGWIATYKKLFEFEGKKVRKARESRQKSARAKAAHVEKLFEVGDVKGLKKPKVQRRRKKEKLGL